MSTDRSRRVRRAFTLAELMVASSVGLLAMAMGAVALTGVAKWYAASQAKIDFATQIKLIDQRIRPDCAGVGHFEIYNDYPTADGLGGKKINKDLERGGNLVVFAVVDTSDPLDPNPGITRIYGYYADVTASESVAPGAEAGTPAARLRRFDSASPTGAGDIRAWQARFRTPVRLTYAAANSSLKDLLPRASAKSSWPEIARLDYGAIRLAAQVRKADAGGYSAAKDPNTGLLAQIFYGRPGALMMNLPIRYGTARESYLVPLTLSFATHQ